MVLCHEQVIVLIFPSFYSCEIKVDEHFEEALGTINTYSKNIVIEKFLKAKTLSNSFWLFLGHDTHGNHVGLGDWVYPSKGLDGLISLFTELVDYLTSYRQMHSLPLLYRHVTDT